MYITTTKNNTIKSTPSRGFSGEIPGELKRQEPAEVNPPPNTTFVISGYLFLAIVNALIFLSP